MLSCLPVMQQPSITQSLRPLVAIFPTSKPTRDMEVSATELMNIMNKVVTR
ncbi:putative Calpain small subunit 1 protein, partial [Naja naja]